VDETNGANFINVKMNTKVTTPELVRMSYVNLDQPKTAPGATEPKFSMSVIIPKANKKTLQAISDAVKAAEAQGKEKFGTKWAAKKFPLRDGDKERDDEAYANSYFLNASNKQRPGMVDANVQEILDPKQIKSGDWGKVVLNFYPFSVQGNSGIGVSLNHVQLCRKGEALGNVSYAEDEFETFEDEVGEGTEDWMR
jgi:hypothetical protein